MIFDFSCRGQAGGRRSAQELCVAATRLAPEVLSVFVSQFLILRFLFAIASFS